MGQLERESNGEFKWMIIIEELNLLARNKIQLGWKGGGCRLRGRSMMSIPSLLYNTFEKLPSESRGLVKWSARRAKVRPRRRVVRRDDQFRSVSKVARKNPFG